jgi:hypothetical protein
MACLPVSPEAWTEQLDIIRLSRDDASLNDLQVRRLVARYGLSGPLAVVVAELAFSGGRPG